MNLAADIVLPIFPEISAQEVCIGNFQKVNCLISGSKVDTLVKLDMVEVTGSSPVGPTTDKSNTYQKNRTVKSFFLSLNSIPDSYYSLLIDAESFLKCCAGDVHGRFLNRFLGGLCG